MAYKRPPRGGARPLDRSSNRPTSSTRSVVKTSAIVTVTVVVVLIIISVVITLILFGLSAGANAVSRPMYKDDGSSTNYYPQR